MTRKIVPLAAAALFLAAPASAEEMSDHDRFRLWNACKPMRLAVEPLRQDAADIALAKDAIEGAHRVHSAERGRERLGRSVECGGGFRSAGRCSLQGIGPSYFKYPATVITVANRIGGEDDIFIEETKGMRGWTRSGVLILANGERAMSVWGEVFLEKGDRVDVDLEVRV